jgi:hypothetical protein
LYQIRCISAQTRGLHRNLPLVAGFPVRRPGFEGRSGHVGFVVNKVALGQVFSEYFGFPCQFLSSSIIWGWYNRPISGRRTKWTQFYPASRN